MRLERRIPLLIILSVLLPALLGNYGRFTLETRARLEAEAQRGLAFARFVATSAAPQRGALDLENIARFRQEHGLIAVDLIGADGVIVAADREGAVGQSAAAPAEVRRALAGTPVSRLVIAPALGPDNGRAITMADYLLLRPYREQTALDLWIAVPDGTGDAPPRVLHSRTRLDRVTAALAASFSLQLAVIGVVVGLVAIAMRLALARWIERPLAELGRVAARVAAGDRAARAPVGPDDAIGRLSRAFNAMTDALVTTEREADQDPVIGLLNHRALRRALDRGVEQAVARREPLALLMLDLDGFKGVNDTWGHQAGDRVLLEVGETLLRCTRRGDIVGRYGGDEFMVILPNTGRTGARELLDRLCVAVAAIGLPDLEGGRPLIGTSIGCAVYVEDGDTPDRLIAHADAQLYAMKASGRAGRLLAGR